MTSLSRDLSEPSSLSIFILLTYTAQRCAKYTREHSGEPLSNAQSLIEKYISTVFLISLVVKSDNKEIL